jgi:hypothetical protein
VGSRGPLLKADHEILRDVLDEEVNRHGFAIIPLAGADSVAPEVRRIEAGSKSAAAGVCSFAAGPSAVVADPGQVTTELPPAATGEEPAAPALRRRPTGSSSAVIDPARVSTGTAPAAAGFGPIAAGGIPAATWAVRGVVRADLGPRNEQLVHFGVAPLRKRAPRSAKPPAQPADGPPQP